MTVGGWDGPWQSVMIQNWVSWSQLPRKSLWSRWLKIWIQARVSTNPWVYNCWRWAMKRSGVIWSFKSEKSIVLSQVVIKSYIWLESYHESHLKLGNLYKNGKPVLNWSNDVKCELFKQARCQKTMKVKVTRKLLGLIWWNETLPQSNRLGDLKVVTPLNS